MARNVYTVKQVNSYIKNMFTQDFMLNRIYVKGEVSNCKYHTSGHIYFSLKDESGTIACVMFAGHTVASLGGQLHAYHIIIPERARLGNPRAGAAENRPNSRRRALAHRGVYALSGSTVFRLCGKKVAKPERDCYNFGIENP